MHLLRELRHVIADLDARRTRSDRLELTAEFAGSVGLHVPHILLRRSAVEKDEEARLGSAASKPLSRGGTQHIGKSDAEQPQRTNLEQVASGDLTEVEI